ncbi:MAG: glycosyltransferase family 1 protein [Ignavibacteriales bacterium]|nr:MAG: glycosyltransferase family 1 protein [Ignavibacteriales bacterium]
MQNKVNILQISVRADIGGGPEHLYNLVKGSTQKFNYFIAAPNDKPYLELFRSLVGNDNIIIIPHRKFRVSAFLSLREFIKKNNISIIHSHGKGAGIYGRLLALITGKRSIHTLHGFHIGKYNLLQKQLYFFIERILSIFSQKIIAVSEGEKKHILESNICSESKILVIENGIKIPDQFISQENFNQTPKKLMHLTRFDYQKNTSQLISICNELKERKELNNFQFNIYGEGEEFEAFKQQIIDLELENSIILKGADPNAREKLVEGFCYISTSRWEGLPISLLEAFAVGLPVICSDTTGNNDLVKNNFNGYLYDISDPSQAVDYLLNLSADQELWSKLSTNARDFVTNNYSLEKMISKIEQVYDN